MFDTLLVQPIFNLLTLIYALVPGHNFGIALIIFTIIVRIMLWPLIKKQLHHAKITRQLQPKLKEIKKATKGDKQAEQRLMMELYKEHGINPFGSLGIMIIQLPILMALFFGVSKLVNDRTQLLSLSYDTVLNLPWMKVIAADLSKFDMTLLGIVDLSKHPLHNGSLYIPGLILALLSAFVQFLTSKQVMISDKDARSVRAILKDASNGKEADPTEMNAALMKLMIYLIPIISLVGFVKVASALSLYWFIGGLIAYFQQRKILGQDLEELTTSTATVRDGDKEVQIESEIISKPNKINKTNSKNQKRGNRKKKRR